VVQQAAQQLVRQVVQAHSRAAFQLHWLKLRLRCRLALYRAGASNPQGREYIFSCDVHLPSNRSE
jgi:hypothetical protein